MGIQHRQRGVYKTQVDTETSLLALLWSHQGSQTTGHTIVVTMLKKKEYIVIVLFSTVTRHEIPLVGSTGFELVDGEELLHSVFEVLLGRVRNEVLSPDRLQNVRMVLRHVLQPHSLKPNNDDDDDKITAVLRNSKPLPRDFLLSNLIEVSANTSVDGHDFNFGSHRTVLLLLQELSKNTTSE